jgi:predicted DNA-binding transcriptional regulator YafY
VVVRHGRWYLLCRSRAADAPRTYRIDRVEGVEVLDETFEPPEDLDPVDALEEHLGSGWEYRTEVIIDAPLELAGRCLSRTLGQLSVIDEHTTRLTGSTSNPVWYAEQLAALPTPFRVVECDELRAATRAIGERMLAASS